MTHNKFCANIANMEITIEKFRELVENAAKEGRLSHRKIALGAGVPYSWIIDMFRKEPQKIDWIRANKVLKYIGMLDNDPIHEMDETLMLAACNAIAAVAKKKKYNLTLSESMSYAVTLYKHVLDYRENGHDISPSEAMAALILKFPKKG